MRDRGGVVRVRGLAHAPEPDPLEPADDAALVGTERQRVAPQHPLERDQRQDDEALHQRAERVLLPDHAAVEEREPRAVISSTSAEDIRTHAVSPVSILGGAGAASGAGRRLRRSRSGGGARAAGAAPRAAARAPGLCASTARRRPARAGSSGGPLPSSVSAFSPQSLLGRENGPSAAHPARARSRRARRCGCESPSPPGE